MIADEYDDDAHFCLKCHATIVGLDNYVGHRKAGGCGGGGKGVAEPPKSPPPSQLLPPDESFDLKADDFFSSLELRSSSKKAEAQAGAGKHQGGILTRSKTTAVIQATTPSPKDPTEAQQSKSGKNVWIGGDQLKELGHGDNHSKLIKAVANLERRKEELPKMDVFEDTDEESEEFDFDDVDESSSDDQDFPPRHHTGGKWKPSSPVHWPRTTSDSRDWNAPPPTHTGGKWKPNYKRSTTPPPPPPPTPPPSHTKGKWPPPSFTGSKWVPKKQEDSSIPPPSFTGSKWVAPKKQDGEDCYNRGRGKSKLDIDDERGGTENDALQSPSYTKGKCKPRTEDDEDFLAPSHSKTKWKTKTTPDPDPPQPTIPKHKPSSSKPGRTETTLFEATYTKGKWLPSPEGAKPSRQNPLQKSSGTVQYWCGPCNRRLASKVVYERHLKSELHFKRTAPDRDFDELLTRTARRPKLKLPERIFSSEEATTSGRKRKRKKVYERCRVCSSKVNKYLIGKHLISHYHCRKGDIRSEEAKRMVLDHIHDVVLESPFQCSACKFYCNTQQYFLQHWLSPEHTAKVRPGHFFCLLCKYRTEDTALMYAHLTSPQHSEVVAVINRSLPIVIKKIDPVSCRTCGHECLLNVQLLDHCRKFGHDAAEARNEFVGPAPEAAARTRRRISNRGASRRRCEYCEESFGNVWLLKEHLGGVHPERKIRCPHCGMSFALAQDLSSHVRLKSCSFEDTPSESLRCARCPFSSASASELFFHVALHEPPAPPDRRYACPVCEKRFPKGSLRAHIRQHTHERPFACGECGKTFARKNNLRFHAKNHEKARRKAQARAPAPDGKPFLCSVCGASFARKSILQQHMQIHTGKECKCSYVGCVYTARRASEINEHFKTHLDAKNHACQVCDYKGKSKQHLTRHMTLHVDTKKYQCSQCSFASRDSTHLKRHIRIHTGAKPFCCPYCSYKCNNLENLRKHVLSTNKHPGKCIYECKFCAVDGGSTPFRTNFAKEFKAHLVTRHAEAFENGVEAATYVAGIYDVHDDRTCLNDGGPRLTLDVINEQPETDQDLAEDVDKAVSPQFPSGTSHDHILAKDDHDGATVTTDNLPDSWSLVGRYNVEETSGTLIPFQSDSLFQGHF